MRKRLFLVAAAAALAAALVVYLYFPRRIEVGDAPGSLPAGGP